MIVRNTNLIVSIFEEREFFHQCLFCSPLHSMSTARALCLVKKKAERHSENVTQFSNTRTQMLKENKNMFCSTS